MRIRFLLLMIFFLTFVNGWGKDIYVSPGGSDSNDGSFLSPYLTLTKALGNCSSGDNILMRGGVYEYTTRHRINQVSGTDGNECILQSYDDEKVVLDFSGMTTSSGNQGLMLEKDYWIIRGIIIKGAGDNGLLIDNGHHNIIEKCVFLENRDTGLQLKNTASYNSIINCDSYRNFDPQNNGENADGFAPKLTVGPGNYFYGCRAFENSDDGWDLYEAAYEVVIENCWAFNNGYNVWGIPIFDGDGNAFKLGGNYVEAPQTIIRSLAFYNRGKGFDQNHNMGPVSIYNNTAYRNQGKDYQFYEEPNTAQKHIAKNNICYPVDVNFHSTSELANNSWQIASVSDADFVSVDSSGVTGPRQIDGSLPDLGFLKLASESEMIDAGVAISGISFSGIAPDLGAREYSVSTSLNVIGKKQAIKVWPNPAVNFLFIQTEQPIIVTDISLFDASGFCVRNFSDKYVFEDSRPTKIKIAGISPGIYFLNIKAQNESFVFKVLKE